MFDKMKIERVQYFGATVEGYIADLEYDMQMAEAESREINPNDALLRSVLMTLTDPQRRAVDAMLTSVFRAAVQEGQSRQRYGEVDCDFYYFNPNGKWRYYGEGRFPRPTGEGWQKINHDTVYQENKGMPGILGNGKTYILLIIPKENCQVKTAYPRLVFPEA